MSKTSESYNLIETLKFNIFYEGMLIQFLPIFVLFCVTLNPCNGDKGENKELSWMPPLRNHQKSCVESVIFANSLNASPELFSGFDEPSEILFMPVVVERSQLVACKLYTARDEGSHKHGISDSERETIIHDILKFLPKSLSFQMASVAPKRIVVPGVSASLFASTSSSELEDAAAAAGVSTSSELFKSMKRVSFWYHI